LELDSGVLARCRKLFIRALRDNRQMTRNAMMHLLEKERISTVEMRGYHVLWRLAQEGLLCFAGRQGKQHTFALLEEWAPEAVGLERDAALAELARRYFTGHGPATLQDFVWWTGLKISDAKAALESVSSQLRREEVEGISYWMAQETPLNVSARDALYLLPGFDEYLLGYRDRSVVLEPKHAPKAIIDANGTLLSTIVLDGRVIGTWKRVLNRREVLITARTFAPLSKGGTKSLKAASDLYGRFVGRAVAR
jgi:Winged helix DNA-binding domain